MISAEIVAMGGSLAALGMTEKERSGRQAGCSGWQATSPHLVLFSVDISPNQCYSPQYTRIVYSLPAKAGGILSTGGGEQWLYDG